MRLNGPSIWIKDGKWTTFCFFKHFFKHIKDL